MASSFIKINLELNEVPITHFDTGKDIILDVQMLSNFSSGGLLYVDANGLEMQEKGLNERKEFNLSTSNLIASNFYPITSAISIRD